MSQSTLKTTRYQELYDRLRGHIGAGILAPGSQLPSFPELRAEGYGQATVERALQKLEADGLIQRTNGRGVFVAPGRGVLPRTGLVGLLGLRDEGGLHPYWSEILTGIQDAVGGAGYDLVLNHNADEARWEKLEGAIAVGYAGLNWARKRPLTMPLAAVMASAEDVPCFHVAEFDAIREAVAHLAALGHRRIGYLVADPGAEERTQSYLAGLREAGIEPQDQWMRSFRNLPSPGPSFFANGANAVMQQWLQEDWFSSGLTALLVWNDDAAFGACRALRAAGLQVPADVSVVGFDGTPLAQLAEPTLTTLEIPLREMGQAVGCSLVSQMRGEDPAPGTTLYPATLSVGGSTSVPKLFQAG